MSAPLLAAMKLLPAALQHDVYAAFGGKVVLALAHALDAPHQTQCLNAFLRIGLRTTRPLAARTRPSTRRPHTQMPLAHSCACWHLRQT